MMLFHKYTFSRSLETGKKKKPQKKIKVLKHFKKNKVYPSLQKKGRDLQWGAESVLSWVGRALLAGEMQNELKEDLRKIRTA